MVRDLAVAKLIIFLIYVTIVSEGSAPGPVFKPQKQEGEKVNRWVLSIPFSQCCPDHAGSMKGHLCISVKKKTYKKRKKDNHAQ